MNSYTGELIKQLEAAVNRAMNSSPEVLELLRESHDRGLYLEPHLTLEVEAIACASFSVERLESLYQLSDRRGDRP